MKIFKLSIVWIAASMLMFGCSDEKEGALKSISGKVTDSRTGRSIADVTVSSGSALTSTDYNGMYVITDLKSGNYTLTFSREGYETNKQQTTIMGRDMIVDCVLEPLTEENSKSISGKVTDAETGNPIKSVTVSTNTSNTTTDANGLYTLSNLKSGQYTLSFSVNDYETRQLTTTIAEQNVTLNCALTSIYASATVSVDDFVAISDGIYYYFKPSANTKKYYWSHYQSNNSILNNENEIIEDLLSDGVFDDGYNEGYSYNMKENTKYTVCIIAFDANNKRGKLVKKEITTKSSQNQPLASITINSITGTSIIYSVVKNSYCSSFIRKGFINLDMPDPDPDIVWASYCYEDYKASKDIFTQDRINITWNGWQNNCIIVSLGFDSKGENSGIISKEYFTVSTSKSASNTVNNTSPIQKEKEMKANFDKRIFMKHED